MNSYFSWKDHVWILWLHAGVIYDFLDFIQGSYMTSWISFKDHIWFLGFHRRIVLRNRVWTVWNHIWSVYEIKEISTWETSTNIEVEGLCPVHQCFVAPDEKISNILSVHPQSIVMVWIWSGASSCQFTLPLIRQVH